MRNSIFLIIIAVLCFAGILNDSEFINKRELKKKRFRSGEELTYSLSYGFIHGGNASITLRLTEYENKKVYHAKVIAKSVGLTDRIFKIEDIYESYFDTKTCLPYKSIRNISEGNYRYYNEVFFTNQDCTVFSQRSGTIKVPPDILDMVSSLFYLRNMELDTLKKGDVIGFVTFFGDDIFPFPLRYKGLEVVKTKLGKFNCFRFDPVVEVGRVFESEDDMTLWITADQNYLPLRIRMDMTIGAVYCDLISYKNTIIKPKPID